MTGLIHPNAIKQAFEDTTGLRVINVIESPNSDYFDIELNRLTGKRKITISSHEAMILFGKMMQKQNLERKVEETAYAIEGI